MAKPELQPDALEEPLRVARCDGGWEFRVGAIATINIPEARAQSIARYILGLPDEKEK